MVKGTKKVAKTFLGFTFGGFYKVGYIHIFRDNESTTVDEVHDRMKTTFGEQVSGRCVATEELDVHFDEFVKLLEQKENAKQAVDVYQLKITEACEVLKKATGAKQLRIFSPAKPAKEDDGEEKESKKSKKEEKPKKAESEAPKEAEKKPAPKDETSDESDSESESEDEKPKKPVKKEAPKKEVKEVKKEAPKKEAKKETPKKEAKKKVESEDEDSDSSDDE